MTKRFVVAVLCFIAFNIYAEDVHVEYFGNVKLQDYSCSYVTSSLVKRVCFDEKRNSLILLLRNSYYSYCNVPKEKLQQLISASSIGKYYNEEIKGKFDCR